MFYSRIFIALLSLFIELSVPIAFIVSNKGGDSLLPVKAILIGKNNCPAFRPNSSANALNSISKFSGSNNFVFSISSIDFFSPIIISLFSVFLGTNFSLSISKFS